MQSWSMKRCLCIKARMVYAFVLCGRGKAPAPQERSVKLLDVIDVCAKQGAFVFFLLVVNVQCDNANESSIPLPTLSCHMYFLSFSFVLWVLAVAKWLLWRIIYLGSNFHLRFLLLPLPLCDLGSGRLI